MRPPADSSSEAAYLQLDIYREMAVERKLALVEDANQTARLLALAGLRQRHPEEPPERLRRRLFDLVLGPELAERVYGPLE
ncbi:MAG: hypothetical protein R3325_12510 [Thermoanaerobaculia bacterium]|nr:hypothetical protein [Thermoanaerobaculia bacterium]